MGKNERQTETMLLKVLDGVRRGGADRQSDQHQENKNKPVRVEEDMFTDM